MEVDGNYTFDAPQDIVWKAIQDPQILGSVMPGGKDFVEVGENEYKGNIQVKVGPVQGLFTANIKLSDVIAPESYKIQVDGKGAPGFVKANGSMKLEGRDKQTYMEYTGTANVGGRIASVGQRLIDSAARSIINQSLEELNAYLKTQVVALEPLTQASDNVSAPVSAIPASAPVSDYKAPSQFQMGLRVAADVLGDMIPHRMRPIVLGGAIAIVVAIVLLIATR